MTDNQDKTASAAPEQAPEKNGDTAEAKAPEQAPVQGKDTPADPEDAAKEAENRYQGLIKHLKRIDTFRHFSDDDLAHQFLPVSKVLTFQAGDVVLKEGDLDNWVYFLISGQLKVVKRGVVLSQFSRQGDVFGEVSAVDGTPRSATIMAVKQSTCLTLDLGKVEKFDAAVRDAFTSILYRVFATKLAERLRESGNKIVQLEEALARLRPKD